MPKSNYKFCLCQASICCKFATEIRCGENATEIRCGENATNARTWHTPAYCLLLTVPPSFSLLFSSILSILPMYIYSYSSFLLSPPTSSSFSIHSTSFVYCLLFLLCRYLQLLHPPFYSSFLLLLLPTFYIYCLLLSPTLIQQEKKAAPNSGRLVGQVRLFGLGFGKRGFRLVPPYPHGQTRV